MRPGRRRVYIASGGVKRERRLGRIHRGQRHAVTGRTDHRLVGMGAVVVDQVGKSLHHLRHGVTRSNMGISGADTGGFQRDREHFAVCGNGCRGVILGLCPGAYIGQFADRGGRCNSVLHRKAIDCATGIGKLDSGAADDTRRDLCTGQGIDLACQCKGYVRHVVGQDGPPANRVAGRITHRAGCDTAAGTVYGEAIGFLECISPGESDVRLGPLQTLEFGLRLDRGTADGKVTGGQGAALVCHLDLERSGTCGQVQCIRAAGDASGVGCTALLKLNLGRKAGSDIRRRSRRRGVSIGLSAGPLLQRYAPSIANCNGAGNFHIGRSEFYGRRRADLTCLGDHRRILHTVRRLQPEPVVVIDGNGQRVARSCCQRISRACRLVCGHICKKTGDNLGKRDFGSLNNIRIRLAVDDEFPGVARRNRAGQGHRRRSVVLVQVGRRSGDRARIPRQHVRSDVEAETV